MKKSKLNIRLIVFIVVAVLVVGLGIFGIVKLVKGGGSKAYKELSPEQYIKIVENNKYTINDITDSMTSYSYIEKAVMGVKEDKSYQIEYYKFTDEASAENFVRNKKTAIFMLFGTDGTVEEDKTEEYTKYETYSDTTYCTVFRIGNTVICADCKAEQKDEVEKMFKQLGYVVK